MIVISGGYQKLGTFDPNSVSTSCWPQKSWKMKITISFFGQSGSSNQKHGGIIPSLDYLIHKRFGLALLWISWK
jgi:hypothetical protein